ncbi:hypothetical protein C1J03_18975 [Sulfitobacter sp. SK012]|nr:hypothetical protein C1J03_18975 [Sulfitobacter sp. SK012]
MKKTILGSLMATLMAANPMVASSEISKETLDSISTPDSVETSIGVLKFIDGAPLPETAVTVYDYLDRMRGVDAFLKGMPAASVHMLIEGAHSLGAEEAHQVIIFDKLMNAQSLFLTGNSSTMYVVPDLDLERDGPTVIEAPAGALGAFNDAYFRYVGDIGPAGPDKGKGGKYLVLPPGFDGEIPDGYFVVKSPSYQVWVFMRMSITDGLEAATKNVKDNLKVYPLSEVDNPPALELISASGKAFNTVHANNFHFYEELDAVIQKEPLELFSKESRGLFASIGIEKGKAFDPDDRMKAILTDAVAIGNAAARSTVWYPREEKTLGGVRIYPDQNWVVAFYKKNVFFDGDDSQTMNTDARVTFHYPYTAVTPAMANPQPGSGSDYASAFIDADDQPFDGSKTYKVTLPPNVPINNFWSFTLYDSQTRSMLQTDQVLPAIDSIQNDPKENSDGSVDIYFGPEAPAGQEQNWVQSIPGKSFFTILRMYGPMEPWFEQTWRPSDVMLVE